MEILPSDKITNLLNSFLNVQSRRAETIAGNIANADTPGFAAKELQFDEFLRDAAKQTFELSANSGANANTLREPRVVERTNGAIGLDGNTVDAAREMSDLAQTGSNFNFGAKMLQARFRLLRAAIREGR